MFNVVNLLVASGNILPHIDMCWKQWRRNEFEKCCDTQFFVVPFHFLALQIQLVVLVSAFVMVSTVWPVSCLLLFYSRCPRAQLFVKVGGGARA